MIKYLFNNFLQIIRFGEYLQNERQSEERKKNSKLKAHRHWFHIPLGFESLGLSHSRLFALFHLSFQQIFIKKQRKMNIVEIVPIDRNESTH